MRLCTETVTVFNAKVVGGDVVFYPTVIKGVSWSEEVKATVDPSTGLAAASTTTIRIPADADFGGKEFQYPSWYRDTDPDQTFTLDTGDLIVKGEYEGSLTQAAIMAAGRVVTILGVQDNRRVLAKHWRVTGR